MPKVTNWGDINNQYSMAERGTYAFPCRVKPIDNL